MVILRAYLNFPIKPCYTVNGIKLCIFCLCDLKISHAYKSIINLTPDYL